MNEEWLDIPGYEGLYQVSSLGRVRSLDRTVVSSNGVPRRLKGLVLKQAVASHGYATVSLHRNKAKSHTVHSLVANAFLTRPDGPLEVCHDDGSKLNNAAVNLYWGTRADNSRDQVRHGTHPHAFKTHCPKGHEYSKANTYLYDGRRTCRTCQAAARRRYEERNAA